MFAQGKSSKYQSKKAGKKPPEPHQNLPCSDENCILTFANAKERKKHIRKVHTKKVFKCGHKDCGEVFDTKGGIREHSKTHRKKHICPVADCAIEFPSSKARRNHVKAKHPELAPPKPVPIIPEPLVPMSLFKSLIDRVSELENIIQRQENRIQVLEDKLASFP